MASVGPALGHAANAVGVSTGLHAVYTSSQPSFWALYGNYIMAGVTGLLSLTARASFTTVQTSVAAVAPLTSPVPVVGAVLIAGLAINYATGAQDVPYVDCRHGDHVVSRGMVYDHHALLSKRGAEWYIIHHPGSSICGGNVAIVEEKVRDIEDYVTCFSLVRSVC